MGACPEPKLSQPPVPDTPFLHSAQALHAHTISPRQGRLMGGSLMHLAWAGAVAGPFAAGWLWRRRGWPARVASGLLVVGWVLGVWAFLVEPETLVVRHVTVASAAWRGP